MWAKSHAQPPRDGDQLARGEPVGGVLPHLGPAGQRVAPDVCVGQGRFVALLRCLRRITFPYNAQAPKRSRCWCPPVAAG
jgi:hypothetical protein